MSNFFLWIMCTRSHLKCTGAILNGWSLYTHTTFSNSTFSFISEHMMILLYKILSLGTWWIFRDKTLLLKTQKKPTPNSTQNQHAYKKTNTKLKILRWLFNSYWTLRGNTFKSFHLSYILLHYIEVRCSVEIPQFVVEIKIPYSDSSRHSRMGSGIFKTISN